MSRLNAMDGKTPIRGGVVYVDQHIRDQAIALDSRLPSYETYTSNAGTITAGSESFDLPTTSSAQYGGNLRIRLRSNNTFLNKVTADEMQSFKDGASTSAGYSKSRFYCPVEGVGQTVTVWVWPINASNEAYDLWRSVVIADTTSTDIAAWTLPFGNEGQLALELYTAGAILQAMSQADAEVRGLDKSVAGVWILEASRQEYEEAARRHRIESVGRYQRYVS